MGSARASEHGQGSATSLGGPATHVALLDVTLTDGTVSLVAEALRAGKVSSAATRRPRRSRGAQEEASPVSASKAERLTIALNARGTTRRFVSFDQIRAFVYRVRVKVMSVPPSETHKFDSETLVRLYRLFRSCWQEAATKLSLSSEQELSFRRTIAPAFFARQRAGKMMSGFFGERLSSALWGRPVKQIRNRRAPDYSGPSASANGCRPQPS